jgi:prophage antirepressor-like protein
VAEALGYTWNGIARIEHVPEEWRGVTSVVTPSGTQEMAVLTEPGLFFFLNRSDKPKALPFQKFVAGEVLPSIRKTGSYHAPQGPRLLALAVLEADKLIKEQAKQIEALEPKAQVYDEIAQSGGTKDTSEVAKILGVGPQIFRKWLIQSGIIFYQGKVARPYQEWIDAGYLVCREKPYLRGEEKVIYTQIRFTAKGELWVAKKYYDSRLEAHAS